MAKETPFLYLTTEGRRSHQPSEIEIWFTRYRGNYYVLSYLFERAQWVRNIRNNPLVSFRLGQERFEATARILDPSREPQLVARVKQLSEEKYGWSDGLAVELKLRGKS